ncbi:MAG: hypothetical protein NC822_02665 [Candidatus Omnitrophica bacterium]|nr:hypothetical protein [Candidatus Omnitrophota bacterium]MCM8827442.1 hypothetical protein [Candidatus Omnitrophota bacterium]
MKYPWLVLVGGILFLGVVWVSLINTQNLRKQSYAIESLRSEQEFIKARLNSFKNDMESMGKQFQANLSELKNIQQAMNSVAARENDLVAGLDRIRERLENWQILYDELAQRVDDLNNKIFLVNKEAPTNVQLGEVLVNKDSSVKKTEEIKK